MVLCQAPPFHHTPIGRLQRHWRGSRIYSKCLLRQPSSIPYAYSNGAAAASLCMFSCGCCNCTCLLSRAGSIRPEHFPDFPSLPYHPNHLNYQHLPKSIDTLSCLFPAVASWAVQRCSGGISGIIMLDVISLINRTIHYISMNVSACSSVISLGGDLTSSPFSCL